MTTQIIEKNGKPEWAVIPFSEYQRLVHKAELAEDNRDFDAAASGASELVPAEVLDRLLNNENPLLVWRKHRGLTQHQLAKKTGVAKGYISQIENGKRTPSISVLKAIAAALLVDFEDVMPD
jgi:DNA-binding XRE family transcriptional regulator